MFAETTHKHAYTGQWTTPPDATIWRLHDGWDATKIIEE